MAHVARCSSKHTLNRSSCLLFNIGLQIASLRVGAYTVGVSQGSRTSPRTVPLPVPSIHLSIHKHDKTCSKSHSFQIRRLTHPSTIRLYLTTAGPHAATFSYTQGVLLHIHCESKKLGYFFTAYNFRNIEQIFTKFGTNQSVFLLNIVPEFI